MANTIITATNLVTQETTEQTLQDAGCETDALVNEVVYLVIYSACTGCVESTDKRVVGSLLFGTDEIASSEHEVATSATVTGGVLNGTALLTGDGVKTLKFQFRAHGSSTTAQITNMSISAIPLIGEDYSYDQSLDDTVVATDVDDIVPETISTLMIVVPPGGKDYILFTYCEGAPQGSTAAGGAIVDININGIPIASWVREFEDIAEWFSFAGVFPISLGEGMYIVTIDVLSRYSAKTADFRRPRIIAVQQSMFDICTTITDDTGATTSSDADVAFVPFSILHTPSESGDKIVAICNSILGTAISARTSAMELQDGTTNYMNDYGCSETDPGFDSSRDQFPIMLSYPLDINDPTTLSIYWRCTYGEGAFGRNADNTAGTNSSFVLLGVKNTFKAPKNVSATDGTYTNKVVITWDAPDGEEQAGYSITRDGIVLDTVGAEVTSYNDTTMTSGITYTYGVTANYGESSSGTITDTGYAATIPTPSDPTPTNSDPPAFSEGAATMAGCIDTIDYFLVWTVNPPS